MVKQTLNYFLFPANVSRGSRQPDPLQLLPSFRFVPTRMQVTLTMPMAGTAHPEPPARGPLLSYSRAARVTHAGYVDEGLPMSLQAGDLETTSPAAPSFTLAGLRARLLRGLISPQVVWSGRARGFPGVQGPGDSPGEKRKLQNCCC